MLRIFAPAKLTRTLKILGKLDNGYHEIRSEMISVNWFDEIALPAKDYSIEGCDSDYLDIASNLVTRALEIVDVRRPFALLKRIPVMSGLGGGSSDAAAILRQFKRKNYSEAIRLGSDVPFCVQVNRALVEGIGERITPLKAIPIIFTLIVPKIPISTKTVYEIFDDYKKDKLADQSNDLLGPALLASEQFNDLYHFLCSRIGEPPKLAGSGSTLFYESNKVGILRSHLGSSKYMPVETKLVSSYYV